MKKVYCVNYICENYGKFKDPKISYIWKKDLFFLLFALSVKMKMKTYLTKKNQLRY